MRMCLGTFRSNLYTTSQVPLEMPIHQSAISLSIRKKDEYRHLNGNSLTQNIGTWTYAAPEINDNDIYGTSADIYSLGIILWELIQTSIFGQERLFAIKKLTQKQEIDKDRIDINKFEKVIKFILKMTSKDPSLRPTSYSLLENDFIKSYWTKNLIENAISMHSIN